MIIDRKICKNQLIIIIDLRSDMSDPHLTVGLR